MTEQGGMLRRGRGIWLTATGPPLCFQEEQTAVDQTGRGSSSRGSVLASLLQ